MKICLAQVVPRRTGVSAPIAGLIGLYLQRAERYAACACRTFLNEESLLSFCGDASGRTKAFLMLADSRGSHVTSEQLAEIVGGLRDGGRQQLVFAIGPADGWSKAALDRADRSVSFGRITLPHELAALVAAEQIYRTLTILAGHPYHKGH